MGILKTESFFGQLIQVGRYIIDRTAKTAYGIVI
jgi:hypothetical protein